MEQGQLRIGRRPDMAESSGRGGLGYRASGATQVRAFQLVERQWTVSA